MPVSPKLLLTKLPRVPFFPRRRVKSFFPPPPLSSSSSSSSQRTLLLHHLPRPRRILSLVVLLFTIFYISALLDNSDRSSDNDKDDRSTFSPHSFHLNLPDFAHRRGQTQQQFQASWLREEGQDGSVTVEKKDWEEGGHPIRTLMADANKKWENQLSRQSRFFDQAVDTYQSRYGRAPPKGFDSWWNFTRLNDVRIVDDYDQIHTSITPFLALDPVLLASRLKELLTKEPFAYELQVRRNSPVSITGERRQTNGALEMANLIDGFRQYLPDDFGEGLRSLGLDVDGDEGLVKLSVSGHELGARIMGEEFRSRMMGLAERGGYIQEEQLKVLEDTSRKGAKADGLLKACSWRSLSDRKPFKESTVFTDPYDFSEEPIISPISFIKDALKSFNFCHNPSIIPLHGSYARNSVRTPKLHPQFVLSKIAQSPQILLMAPTVGFQNETKGVTSWEEKTIKKIFWRGTTTGAHYEEKNDADWRESHRVRLNALTNQPPRHPDAQTDVLVEMGSEVRTGRAPSTKLEFREVSMRRLEAKGLNEHLFDVGITEVVQCEERDGTCEEMRDEIKLAPAVRPEEALLYRYAFDIDGNGWSSQFRPLLDLGTVIFKITIYPEWNSEWLTPWLHYIPVNLDLSDLYHSATFFLGAPGVSQGNDDLGRIISEAGRDFVEKHWRWEDMQAYMFRLLLEYRRAMAHDRDAMSMGGKMLLY
ncbi:hypothetical protein BDY24DRAFT_168274 [Mrakia frigida]|uniref:uncharacterized protein n=1 Tax=Mrakia frigida TaxID=29902 RepID=UPI003FCC1B84